MRSRLAPLAAILICSGLSACGGEDTEPVDARFTADCIEFHCTFDASGSASPRGLGLIYAWEFGDGNTGTGQIVEHVYAEPGEYEVKLQAADGVGFPGEETVTVMTTDTPAIDYYYPVRNAISVLIFLTESAAPIVETGDDIQASAETQGAPGADGYTIQCPLAGSVEAVAWDDANSNQLIDGTESLTITADGCSFDSNVTLSSVSEFGLVSDFDSNSFELDMDTSVGSGVETNVAEDIRLRGPVQITTTRTSSNIDTMTLASPAANIVYFAEQSANFIVSTDFDIGFEYPETAGMTGSYSFRFGFGATDLKSDVTIDSPITITESNNTLSLTQGAFTMIRDSETIKVDIASDPAYLRVRVDQDGDGTFDISDQFPQSITLRRLER